MGLAAAPLAIEEVRPGLWSASDGRRRVAFAAGPDGVVAVNTFASDDAARALRSAIERAVPGADVIAVVCSIDHLDLAGRAGVLAPGAEIVAHELCARILAARADDGQAPATRTARGDLERVELGGLELELRYPGPTQGTGNIAVRFVDHGVCYMVGPRGDARLGLLGDVHLEHVVANIRSILALGDPTWIPGRGDVLAPPQVERFCALLEGLQWTAQKAFASGVAVWDLRAMAEYAGEFLRGEFGDLDGFSANVGPAAIRVVHHYLMGGWGLEDTQHPEALLSAAREAR